VREENNHVEAHFLLGGIYKSGGLRTRALHEYERVLELKPEHEEARAAILEVMPEDTADEERPGFLKKLFGKS